MQEEGGHYEKCGIWWGRWEIVVMWIFRRARDIARGVEYAGVGGTLLAVWIFRRWDIARGVEYAGVGGTLRSVWNRQER
jgi:hypothetical protein